MLKYGPARSTAPLEVKREKSISLPQIWGIIAALASTLSVRRPIEQLQFK